MSEVPELFQNTFIAPVISSDQGLKTHRVATSARVLTALGNCLFWIYNGIITLISHERFELKNEGAKRLSLDKNKNKLSDGWNHPTQAQSLLRRKEGVDCTNADAPKSYLRVS